MIAVAAAPQVTRVADLGVQAFELPVARYGVAIEAIANDAPIPGSYWGEPEAGLIGRTVFVRADTPVHSVLHELSHLVCMEKERRDTLYRDAGGDDLEEAAVCYLQVMLAEYVAAYSAATVCADMDAWGYSFRLGSTRRWFCEDADDARCWLLDHGLISPAGDVAFRLR